MEGEESPYTENRSSEYLKVMKFSLDWLCRCCDLPVSGAQTIVAEKAFGVTRARLTSFPAERPRKLRASFVVEEADSIPGVTVCKE